jgi:hypothetical protein
LTLHNATCCAGVPAYESCSTEAFGSLCAERNCRVAPDWQKKLRTPQGRADVELPRHLPAGEYVVELTDSVQLARFCVKGEFARSTVRFRSYLVAQPSTGTFTTGGSADAAMDPAAPTYPSNPGLMGGLIAGGCVALIGLLVLVVFAARRGRRSEQTPPSLAPGAAGAPPPVASSGSGGAGADAGASGAV